MAAIPRWMVNSACRRCSISISAISLLGAISLSPVSGTAAPAPAKATKLSLRQRACINVLTEQDANRPNAGIQVYPGPNRPNGTGILTIINCTGAQITAIHDRTPNIRARVKYVFDPKKRERIPGEAERFQYVSFNPPESDKHFSGFDIWTNARVLDGDRYEGKCVRLVEFTATANAKTYIFSSTFDVCKTDFLIVGWGLLPSA